jgi:hypothetical protein
VKYDQSEIEELPSSSSSVGAASLDGFEDVDNVDEDHVLEVLLYDLDN